jgi:hypothetical protein
MVLRYAPWHAATSQNVFLNARSANVVHLTAVAMRQNGFAASRFYGGFKAYQVDRGAVSLPSK